MIIVAAVSDIHVGSTVSLCPPEVDRDDMDVYKPSKPQQWLWQNWLDYWDRIEAMKRQYQAEVYFVSNGDLFENNHHHSTQLWSLNMADWFRAAFDVVDVAMNVADQAFVVRGTEAHVGAAGCLEESFTAWLSERYPGKVAQPTTKIASWVELMLDADGVLFDISHHGPMGRLEHTRINSLGRVAVQTEIEALRDRLPVPAVALQAHNHKFGDSGLTYDVRVIAMPAWQFRTHFVRRITRSKISDIGGLAFLCDEGEYTMTKLMYQPKRDRRTIWKSPKTN